MSVDVLEAQTADPRADPAAAGDTENHADFVGLRRVWQQHGHAVVGPRAVGGVEDPVRPPEGDPGAIGAEMIARGETVGKGVVPPERCIPAAPFRAYLRERGIVTAITPGEPPLPPFEPPR